MYVLYIYIFIHALSKSDRTALDYLRSDPGRQLGRSVPGAAHQRINIMICLCIYIYIYSITYIYIYIYIERDIVSIICIINIIYCFVNNYNDGLTQADYYAMLRRGQMGTTFFVKLVDTAVSTITGILTWLRGGGGERCCRFDDRKIRWWGLLLEWGYSSAPVERVLSPTGTW